MSPLLLNPVPGIPATSCAHGTASRRRSENIAKESALSFNPEDAES